MDTSQNELINRIIEEFEVDFMEGKKKRQLKLSLNKKSVSNCNFIEGLLKRFIGEEIIQYGTKRCTAIQVGHFKKLTDEEGGHT